MPLPSPSTALVAAAFALWSAPVGATTPASNPPFVVPLVMEGSTPTWRLPVEKVATGEELHLSLIGAAAVPPVAALLSVTFAGSGPACTLTPTSGTLVLSKHDPNQPSPCDPLRALAPNTLVEARVVTTTADQVWKLGIEATKGSGSTIDLYDCIKPKVGKNDDEPEIPAACGAWAPNPTNPTPLLVVNPRDVDKAKLGNDCHILLDRWTTCDSGLLTGTAAGQRQDIWRRLTGDDTAAVYLMGKLAPSDTRRTHFAVVEAKAPSLPPPTNPGAPAADWCHERWKSQNAGTQDDRQLVCIDHGDATRVGPVRILRVRSGAAPESADGVLFANVPVTVIVRIPQTFGGTLKLTGTVGFETTGVLSPDGTFEVFAAEGGRASDVTFLEASYPSLRAGSPTLNVKLKELGVSSSPEYSHDYPLFVDRQVWGAFRTGLAIGYSFPAEGAPYDRYSAGYAAGSTSYEVMDNGSDAWMNSELTFGLSLFLPPLCGTPVMESQLGKPIPAVYLGFGLLDLSADDVTGAIPAVHGGLELSLGRNVGLALTGSLRPTKALAAGLEVGDYVSSGALPHRIAVQPGINILLNLSPENLKLAQAGGS